MKKIHPRQIQDKMYLSRLLDQLLHALEESPMQVRVKALSFDSGISEAIFERLRTLHRHPEDARNIHAQDFHIVFSNVLFRYPTVKLYEQADGEVFFSM